MIPCSTTFVILVQYLLCIIFVFVVFTLINKYDTFQWLLRYVYTHARTHTHALARTRAHTHAHYDILSDIMVILDHGNICVDTIFMILSCIVFQILKKLGFSIMAVLICIHIYAYS